MSREVAIAEIANGRFSIALPDYNDGFRKAMNERIPQSERGWNPEKRYWWVSADWLEFAESIIVEFFPYAEVNYYGG